MAIAITLLATCSLNISYPESDAHVTKYRGEQSAPTRPCRTIRSHLDDTHRNGGQHKYLFVPIMWHGLVVVELVHK
jgi:hypothetical protein